MSLFKTLVWTDGAPQRRMDLRAQASDAMVGLRDLAGEIVIEAAQPRQFGHALIDKLLRSCRRSVRRSSLHRACGSAIRRIGSPGR